MDRELLRRRKSDFVNSPMDKGLPGISPSDKSFDSKKKKKYDYYINK